MTTHPMAQFVPTANPSDYRARYYDPNVGRFTREDPIAFRGGIDFYTYVRNSPINKTDAKGLSPDDRKLPTTPTGKAGCYYVGEIASGLNIRCKTCMYKCRGYGAIVTFPQATLKACPSIDPVTGLINIAEIDPDCRPGGRPCDKKVPAPNPIPFIILLLLGILSGNPELAAG